MPCCGRPSNNAKKGEAAYYERYAFLSSAQKERQAKVAGSQCQTCKALTVGDPCTVCGNPKSEKQEDKE